MWHTIPILEYLQENWRNTAKHSRFYKISNAIYMGLGNLEKWYRKTDNTDAYFICLGKFSRWAQWIFTESLNVIVLNPNVKLAYAEDKWDAKQLQNAIDCLESVVCLFLVTVFCLLSSGSESQFDLYYKLPAASALDKIPVQGMYLLCWEPCQCSDCHADYMLATSSSKVQYGNSWMWKTLQTC